MDEEDGERHEGAGRQNESAGGKETQGGLGNTKIIIIRREGRLSLLTILPFFAIVCSMMTTFNPRMKIGF